MGTGYTRQSAADIVAGEDITAGPLNSEFNQIRDFADGTIGHSHDGTTGEGPKLDLAVSFTGVLPVANGGTGLTAITDLLAIEALAGTSGGLFKTAANTWALRDITGTANQITVTNGNGVAGAPTISLPTTLAFASGQIFNWNSSDVLLTHSADTLVYSGGTSYQFKAVASGSYQNIVTVEQTQAYAGGSVENGPAIELYANRSGAGTPNGGETSGYLVFTSENSADVKKYFGFIQTEVNNVTAGSENGKLILGVSPSITSPLSAATLKNGTKATTIQISNGFIAFTGNSGTSYLNFNLATGTFSPATNDGIALGDLTHNYSDLFLADGGVINWNNSDVTLTHSTNTLTFAGASSGYSFDKDILLPTSGSVINFNAGDVTITHSANQLAFAGASTSYSFDSLLDLSGAAAGQIKFPASQNASANANTLDDYEEGTFIVTAAFATPGSSSWSYVSQAGTYTKIGNAVFLNVEFQGTPTIGTGSGIVSFAGFPFTPATNVTLSVSNMSSNWTWPASRTQIVGIMNSGSANFFLSGLGSANNGTTFAASNMITGGSHSFRVSGIVFV